MGSWTFRQGTESDGDGGATPALTGCHPHLEELLPTGSSMSFMNVDSAQGCCVAEECKRQLHERIGY
jgi:hypothetical protein